MSRSYSLVIWSYGGSKIAQFVRKEQERDRAQLVRKEQERVRVQLVSREQEREQNCLAERVIVSDMALLRTVEDFSR